MNLRKFELKWIAKIMDAIIPPGIVSDFPKSASENSAVRVLEELIKYTPFFTALSFRISIWFIEIIAPLLSGKLAPFSSLNQETREKVLTKLYQSRIYFFRQMVTLFKMTACFGWAMEPETKRGIGVTEPPRFVKRSKT